MKYITGAKFPPGQYWRDEGVMCGLTLWHTDRRQYALLPHWYMMCQSETGWIGGGYLIFWPSSRLVCCHTHTQKHPIYPCDLHLPTATSSVILTWTLDCSPTQSNLIDPCYWAPAQVCTLWVHRCVCICVWVSGEWAWTAGKHPLTRVMTCGGRHHCLNGRFNAWSILCILLTSHKLPPNSSQRFLKKKSFLFCQVAPRQQRFH